MHFIEPINLSIFPTRKVGIYLLFEGKEIIYIGKAKDLRQRLLQHMKKDIEWKQPFLDSSKITKIGYFFCKNKERKKTEIALIKKYKPKYNLIYNARNFEPKDFYCKLCYKRHGFEDKQHVINQINLIRGIWD